MSNYWRSAASVIDTKWWINGPDDSHRLNQSISQYATPGRRRGIRLLMTLDLFTDHWPLDPEGKCIHLLWRKRQRPTVACKWDWEMIQVPDVLLGIFSLSSVILKPREREILWYSLSISHLLFFLCIYFLLSGINLRMTGFTRSHFLKTHISFQQKRYKQMWKIWSWLRSSLFYYSHFTGYVENQKFNIWHEDGVNLYRNICPDWNLYISVPLSLFLCLCVASESFKVWSRESGKLK